MPAIGPYTFTTLRGRLLTATTGVVSTRGGVKLGPRQAHPAPFTGHEHLPSLVAAWQRAWQYRMSVGALARVIDDSGLTADYCLVNDVRCLIRADESGAVLESQWVIIPPLGYGDTGQALFTTALDTGSAPLLQAAPNPLFASNTIRVLTAAAQLTFDSATGDLQIPLYTSQIRDVQTSAKAIGVLTAAQEPPPAGGSLRCDVGAADDAAAFRLQAICRLLIGSAAAVELGGVTITGAVIKDAACAWSLARGLSAGKTILFSVTFEFELQSNDGDDDTAKGSASCVEVQTARTWGSWKAVPGARCDSGEESQYPGIGNLSWILDLGTIVSTRVQRVTEPVDYAGQWCRVQLKTNARGEPDPLGKTRKDLWHGKVQATSISGGNGTGGATMAASCAGVLCAWDQIYLTRWYEYGQDSELADPGELLPFNGAPGGDRGAVYPGNLGGRIGLRPHDRQSAVVARRYTGKQAVEMLLAALKDQYPEHPPLLLVGAPGALSFTADWSGLDGRPFIQQIAAIIDARRGVTWRIEIVDGGWELRISTIVGADTTIAGLGTIPANNRQTAIDLTGTNCPSYNLTADHVQTADAVHVQGGRPWFCLTLAIYNDPANPDQQHALERGWTTLDQDNRALADPPKRDQGRIALVWRKYRLIANWSGGGRYNSTRNDVLRMQRRKDATGAETGVFGTDPAAIKPDARNLRFTRELPIWQGRDWATAATYGEQPPEPGAQLEGPILIGFKPGAAGYEALTDRWQVQVCDHEPAIILGRNAADGDEIAAYLAAGNKILVTIGVLGPLPWRVSWLRVKESRPCDLPRVLAQQNPGVAYRIVVDATVVGLTNASTLTQTADASTKTGATGTCTDWSLDNGVGGSRLDPLLQLARLWSEFPNIALIYVITGIVDTDSATGPGTWRTVATLPLDQQRSYVAPIGNLVTTRRWQVSGMRLQTEYHCNRLLLAMDQPVYGAAAAPAPLAILDRAPGAYQ